MNQSDESSENRSERSSLATWIGLLIIVGVFLGYLFLKRSASMTFNNRGRNHPAVGVGLPGLQLQPLTHQGEPLRLYDLRGQVVLINFWGTWCPSCRMEFPEMVTLSETLDIRNDFRMLLVSCGRDLTTEQAESLQLVTSQFLASRGLDVPTYMDRGAMTRHTLMVAGQLEGFAYPTTVLLDRQGIVRGIWLGYHRAQDAEIRASIEEVLEKPS